jgi:hypothetical protein
MKPDDAIAEASCAPFARNFELLELLECRWAVPRLEYRVVEVLLIPQQSPSTVGFTDAGLVDIILESLEELYPLLREAQNRFKLASFHRIPPMCVVLLWR